jgi:predicted DNA-binding protein (UPF0251 family)
VSEDWYVDAIDRVVSSAEALHAALDRIVEALGEARAERIAGGGLVEIVDGLLARGGTALRRSVDDAFRDYTQAITAYRARAIRGLVDEEGLTLAEVARRTGVSRQMVGRLYRLR